LIEKRSARSKSEKKNRKRGNAVNAPRFIASAAAVLIRPGIQIYGARQLAGSFCHPAIKNDSGTILSRLQSSVCALADEIQDSYQRRD
jgi:hypothetical protein